MDLVEQIKKYKPVNAQEEKDRLFILSCLENYDDIFLRENNIARLNKKICNANVSAIFLDLISNLERIGDHSTNIAERVE